jgi:hypothetical protein
MHMDKFNHPVTTAQLAELHNIEADRLYDLLSQSARIVALVSAGEFCIIY